MDKVNYDIERDKLIFVGDLVNKGPDSLGVLRYVKNHPKWGTSVFCVKGNHETSVIRGWPLKHPSLESWTEHLTQQEYDWLHTLPNFLRLPSSYIDQKTSSTRDVIVVHAGILPNIPVEQQDELTLTTIRTITSDGFASKKHGNGEKWFKLWKGPEFLVYGHDAKTGEMRKKNSYGLDGGCCYGRRLLALELPVGVVHEVNAAKVYSAPE